MKAPRRQVNVAAALIIGADFAMMLTALTLALPPSSYAWSVLAPRPREHSLAASLQSAGNPDGGACPAAGKVTVSSVALIKRERLK